MIQRTRFFLWFVPTGEVYTKLAQIIAELAEKYGGPVFEPHVTLLGDIEGSEKEISKKTRKLTSLIPPIDIQLIELGHSDRYSRCVYIRAEKSQEILDANRQAAQIFSQVSETGFMPHLSLLYGNFEEMTRKKIIAELNITLPITFKAEKLIIINAPTREVKDWRNLGKLPLSVTK